MVKENSKVFLLILLGMLTAFGPFVTDMYLPSLPSMGDYFSTTSSMVQLGLTTSMIGLAVGQVFFGPLSDRYGRRLPLLVAMWLFIISTLLCLFSQSIEQFVAFRLLQGIAGAGGIVISRSVATDKFSGRELAKMLAVIGAINGVAPVAAPIVGGLLTDLIGWQGIFWILFGLGILLLAGCCHFRESLSRDQRSAEQWTDTFRSFGIVLCDRRYVCYVLQMAFAQGVLFANIASSPFIVQQHYGFSAFAFSLCFGVNALAIGIAAALSVKFHRPESGSHVGMRFLGLRGVDAGLAVQHGHDVHLEHSLGDGKPAGEFRHGLGAARCRVLCCGRHRIAAGRYGQHPFVHGYRLRGLRLLFAGVHSGGSGPSAHASLLCVQHLPEALRQVDVRYSHRVLEERGNLLRPESGDAAAYFRDEERQFGMLAGEADEVVHIGFDGVGASVHGRDAVGLSLQACALSPYGSPLLPGQQGGASAVGTFQVAAENEYLTGLQLGDAGGCDSCFHHLVGFWYETKIGNSYRICNQMLYEFVV